MTTRTMTLETLREALRQDRLDGYVKLRGGYPIPLAGMTYWLVLGALGYRLELPDWSLIAFIGSGIIFPLALLFAKLFRNDFMKEKHAADSVLLPAFISMLLFWTMIAAAAQEGPALIPLILAIGMSLHWPVIGWAYGRTAIYSAHAIVRAAAVLGIWLAFPEHRLTWLPFAVAATYALTVVAILIDSGRIKKMHERQA